MYHFYTDKANISEKTISIFGEDVNHILNVLRLSIGDEITISDGSSRDYLCQISDYSSDNSKFGEPAVIADIIDISDSNAELPAEIYLFQGVPKGDKLETIIQKCVELGVYSIIPVMMERTIVKLDDKKKEKKINRYNAIAESAAKQSRRGIIPKILDYMTMDEAISFAESQMDTVLFPYELAEGMDLSREIINSLVKEVVDKNSKKEKMSIGIFIGPEGGFSENEAMELEGIDAKIVSLGHRILRTETAGMTVMSILSFLMDK